MSEYDNNYIRTIFKNEANFDVDMYEVFDTHFRSIDTSDKGYGNEVFSVTRKLARFLLHNCKHEVPTDRQVKRILRLKAHYDFHGAGESWTGKPIIINNKTRTIEDGITRLYAIALGKRHGYSQPMLLKED